MLFRTAISSRSADLAHKVHWTLCLKPNHALKELEMRYAISSSVKARSRSSASALSGSALRIAFARDSSSAQAGRSANTLQVYQCQSLHLLANYTFHTPSGLPIRLIHIPQQYLNQQWKANLTFAFKTIILYVKLAFH
ncbi:hypothetical protein CG396_06190 [Bifidobacteriaceae bacterium N170]|nr:hypothetical protein CG396_06190 [Bifidobacteriaceae bacterium N170]